MKQIARVSVFYVTSLLYARREQRIALYDFANAKGVSVAVKRSIIVIVLCFSATLFTVGRSAATAEESVFLTLSFGSLEFTYEDKRLEPTDHTVITEFYERRINAPLSDRLDCVERSLDMGAGAKAALLYTFPLLETTVDEAVKSIDRVAQNATIAFRPSNRPMFTITRERKGYRVDEQELYYDIYRALKHGETKVKIKPQALLPSVTAKELKKQTALRASFSTDYASSSANRKHNVELALSRLSGTVIDDGEELSFNERVGSRTKENGYADAKVIVGGEYVEGVGGGVCQASTTLYNCALLAGLTITSVKSHTLAPSYVAPSFDAMVSNGYSDLRLKNESGAPVYLYCSGDGKTALVKLYGLKKPYVIKRESVVVSRSDPPDDLVIVDESNEYGTEELADGEKKRVRYGIKGTTSEGYLCYYEGGRLTARVIIRRDAYMPVRGVVAVKPKTIQNSS